MIKFSQQQKLELYRLIEDTGVFDELCRLGTFPSVVARVWNIHDMPSEDSRFATKYEDINQHYVNNPGDATFEELFLSKLKIQKENNLEKLIVALLSEKGFENAETRFHYAKIFNRILEKFDFSLAPYVTPEGDQVFIFAGEVDTLRPNNIQENKIKIFIDAEPEYPTNKKGNHINPTVFPAIVMALDFWKDGNARLQFDVFYYPDKDSKGIHIGKTKVMVNENRHLELENAGEEIRITDYMGIHPKERTLYALPIELCSLGQSDEFYSNLKNNIVDINKVRSLLWDLKDAAVFPILQELNEDSVFWSSLIRERSADRMLRYGRGILYGETGKPKFHFTFKYKPPYSEQLLNVSFGFSKKLYFSDRIFAIIGKNGCGKTRLLSTLPEKLKLRSPDAFDGEIPRFGKIIAVSNSHFDNFEIPTGNADFNYIYCGLSVMNGDKREPLEMKDILERIIENFKHIIRLRKSEDLFSILEKTFTKTLLDSIIKEPHPLFPVIDEERLKAYIRTMSSGETDILYFISSLLRHIRSDSLILFDEPENHLHPNIISALMEMLNEIVEEYDSYAIIATHSPLVIRELRADNVFVMERIEDSCLMCKIGIESLGANLTEISDYIFGNKDVSLLYRSTIDHMVSQGLNYDEIVSHVKSGDLPLNPPLEMYIAARLYIHNLQNRQE